MTDPGVRCLYRPGQEPAPRTNTNPRGPTKQALIARGTLGEFLDATLVKPLYFSEANQHARIEEALDTMTLAERIAIEIEMQSRNAVVHSFDYDPLR